MKHEIRNKFEIRSTNDLDIRISCLFRLPAGQAGISDFVLFR